MNKDTKERVTVYLPKSVLNYIDKIIDEGLTDSRCRWVRDAIEQYIPIFTEACKRIKADPTHESPEVPINFDIVKQRITEEISQDQREQNIDQVKKRSGRRIREVYHRHIPLGNIHHPEIDYSKPSSVIK